MIATTEKFQQIDLKLEAGIPHAIVTCRTGLLGVVMFRVVFSVAMLRLPIRLSAKWICAVCFVLVGMFGSAGPLVSVAQADTDDLYCCYQVRGVASDDILNVRLSTDHRSRILYVLRPDQTNISIARCRTTDGVALDPDWPNYRPADHPNNVWCEVYVEQYAGTGWVNAAFLEPQPMSGKGDISSVTAEPVLAPQSNANSTPPSTVQQPTVRTPSPVMPPPASTRQKVSTGQSTVAADAVADVRAAELYRQACDGGEANGCNGLGTMYADGKGVQQDDARAVELYRQACDGGEATGCFNLGNMYRMGRGVPQDVTRALELYWHSCDGVVVTACNNLGSMYAEGNGVPQDDARAVQLYRQSCDGGQATGCYNLGNQYADGTGVTQDNDRAVELYRQACDGGDANGCINLGIMNANGSGVQEDDLRAVALYRQACDGGEASGCINLGVSYEDGLGVPQDDARAVQLYRQACDGGAFAGCINLGNMYADGKGVQQDDARAVALYRQACDGGEALGCLNLSVMFGEGRGVPQDNARALELLRQACDGGNATGCFNLGVKYAEGRGLPQDDVRALELYRQACNGGEVSGCFNLGIRYTEGNGVQRDDARAAELYRQACDGGEASGCINLGVSYEDGLGVQQDDARAAELYRQACDGGHETGCSNLRDMSSHAVTRSGTHEAPTSIYLIYAGVALSVIFSFWALSRRSKSRTSPKSDESVATPVETTPESNSPPPKSTETPVAAESNQETAGTQTTSTVLGVREQLFELLCENNKAVRKKGLDALAITHVKTSVVAVADIEFHYSGTWSGQQMVENPDKSTSYKPYWVPVEGVHQGQLVFATLSQEKTEALAKAKPLYRDLSFSELNEHIPLSRDSVAEYVGDLANRVGLSAGRSMTPSWFHYVQQRFVGKYNIQHELFRVVEFEEVTFTFDKNSYTGIFTDGRQRYAGDKPDAMTFGGCLLIVSFVLAGIGLIFAVVASNS